MNPSFPSFPTTRLELSPLSLVLVQARFSAQNALVGKVKAFRKRIEALGFQVFRHSREQALQIGPGSVISVEKDRWDFLDKSLQR